MDVSCAEVDTGCGYVAVDFKMNNEELSIALSETLCAGSEAKLHFKWKAPLGTSLKGYYLSQSAAKTCALTMLEPGCARRAFP